MTNTKTNQGKKEVINTAITMPITISLAEPIKRRNPISVNISRDTYGKLKSVCNLTGKVHEQILNEYLTKLLAEIKNLKTEKIT